MILTYNVKTGILVRHRYFEIFLVGNYEFISGTRDDIHGKYGKLGHFDG